MTSKNEPSTSQSNSNPVLVTKISYKDEDIKEEEKFDDEVYAMGTIFEEEFYTTQ